MTLLTRDEFVSARDEIALESMLARLADLEPTCHDLERQYVGLRRMLLATKDRNEIDGLTYELYAKPSGEFGDYGGIAWRWASVDAEIGDIERDARYIAWLETQRLSETA